MRSIAIDDAFVPAGCPGTEAGVPAVSVQAGARWGEVYEAVAVKHGRYVQGGGCTSVGAAGGFLQGGGFGSFSKKFGTGAANALEMEVVTADGRIVIANRCQHSDLFWALRGGGGGTFGVVSRVTLMTHPLPETFGAVGGTITAKTDEAFATLLEAFVRFYRARLSEEHWGEQITVRPDNSLNVSMLFEGLSEQEARDTWRPFLDWVAARPAQLEAKVDFVAIPAGRLWDVDFLERSLPSAIVRARTTDASQHLFFWATNQEEVSAYWYAYQSRWLPLDLFDEEAAPELARLLLRASRSWPVALHFNKGLAGAAPDALARSKETSMNPAVFDAAALVIMAANARAAFPGVAGHAPDAVAGAAEKTRVAAGMKAIRDATPGAGSYVNETDYFEPDWQSAFWGASYPRLLEIKKKYDPDGVFFCHHCVGSELWSPDGTCPAARAR